jgi:uncharacterized membrane protein
MHSGASGVARLHACPPSASSSSSLSFFDPGTQTQPAIIQSRNRMNEPPVLPPAFSDHSEYSSLLAMIVLVILFCALLLFRALGFCGIPLFASWKDSMVFALAVMFCFTGLAHFGPIRGDLERMVPPWIRNPRAAIFWTGILEILGAIGLAIPDTRRLAGVCLVLFLIAVFPANIHAARSNMKLAGKPITPIWIRGPMQLLFILLIIWVTQL